MLSLFLMCCIILPITACQEFFKYRDQLLATDGAPIGDMGRFTNTPGSSSVDAQLVTDDAGVKYKEIKTADVANKFKQAVIPCSSGNIYITQKVGNPLHECPLPFYNTATVTLANPSSDSAAEVAQILSWINQKQGAITILVADIQYCDGTTTGTAGFIIRGATLTTTQNSGDSFLLPTSLTTSDIDYLNINGSNADECGLYDAEIGNIGDSDLTASDKEKNTVDMAKQKLIELANGNFN